MHPFEIFPSLPLLSTIVWLILISTRFFAFFELFDDILTLAVAQSSEFHCPRCFAWATLTLPSASRTHANRPNIPFQCRTSSLNIFLNYALNPSTPSKHELSTSPTYVCTRYLDTGYCRSHSPFDSHLNRHVLSRYSTCLANHSRTSPCASRQRHPKDSSPPLYAPPQR